jgi:hypothetical protein
VAQRHAEDLQRQHEQRRQIGLPEAPLDPQARAQIDAQIDSIHDLTEHQRRFLRSHPTLMTEPYASLMKHAIMVARHAGIPDDTPAMDRAILQGVARDIEHHRNLSNHQQHHDAGQAARELSREADMHLAAYQPEPPPERRKSIPMSAPVSRSVPGNRDPDGWNTLSPDEVQIAHNSFSDPNMSHADKELLYLRNRQKLARMKKDGTYSDQTGG